jgi:hypothetical protein
MPALPFYAIAVVVNDQVRLRVYRGKDIVVDMPLRRRQAMVLAAQLLNQALLPEYPPDPLMLEPAEQHGVTRENCTHDG